MRDGFTLVETLIALMMAAILLTVSASALMKILRAEGTAAKMQQTALAIQTIGSRTALGVDTNGEIQPVVVQQHNVKFSGAQWTVWDITCTSFPPLSTTLEYPVRE